MASNPEGPSDTDAQSASLRAATTEVPSRLDEPDWLRHRVEQLRKLRQFVSDGRARAAIDELIAEAEERLERIDALRPRRGP
jgi:Ser/Thr protein kinase RdoA (MazF antagonist)